MGFATKVQLIKRKLSEQWYINFPSAVAQAMNFKKGETVEWVIEDKAQLVLNRLEPPESALKKKRRNSAPSSSSSGKDAGGPSISSARS
jgi:bifunctional DNA-binding transcriptional regulator/antitoxin component of YhaV-PrlF toxin-antitoxin module